MCRDDTYLEGKRCGGEKNRYFKDISHADLLKIPPLLIGNYSAERKPILTFKMGNDYREGENGYLFLNPANSRIVPLLCHSHRPI